MALSALAGTVGAAAATLVPLGQITGGFDCFNTNQLLTMFKAGGFTQELRGEAGGGERFSLWVDDKLDQFIITMELPGMLAMCVVTNGKY